MGCNNSKPVDGRKSSQMQRYQAVFDDLGINETEAGVLYDIFAKADVNCDDQIQRSEFFALMAVEDKPYARRLFGAFDRKAKGEVNFGEWSVALWQFCTYTRASLAKLAFRMMDADGNGSIDAAEVKTLIKELADDPAYAVDAKAVLAAARESRSAEDKADQQEQAATATAAEAAPVAGGDAPKVDGDAADEQHQQITEEAFLAFALAHPAVTLPALRLQKQLREAIGGEAFWETASLRRGNGAATAVDAAAAATAIPKDTAAAMEMARARSFAAAAEASECGKSPMPAAAAAGPGEDATAPPAPVHGPATGAAGQENIVSALARIRSGRVAAADMDVARGAEASSRFHTLVGSVTERTLAGLASGVDMVVGGRAGKYAASRKKNSPASANAVALKTARDKASDSMMVTRERAEATKCDVGIAATAAAATIAAVAVAADTVVSGTVPKTDSFRKAEGSKNSLNSGPSAIDVIPIVTAVTTTDARVKAPTIDAAATAADDAVPSVVSPNTQAAAGAVTQALRDSYQGGQDDSSAAVRTPEETSNAGAAADEAAAPASVALVEQVSL